MTQKKHSNKDHEQEHEKVDSLDEINLEKLHEETDMVANVPETELVVDLSVENQNLKAEIEKLEKIIANNKEHQRKLMLATKVNTLKEQEIINDDFRKYAKQSLIENSIMPVLENFERALNIETTDSKLLNFLKGFQYVFDSLKDSLKKEGLYTINVKPGDSFDSHKCEAVETEWVQQLASDEKDNMIIKVLVSGYQLHSRIIKPAKVKIIKLKIDNNKNEKTTEL